jgi:hypothetical protein
VDHKPLLVIDILITNERKERLVIFKDDQVDQKIDEFCSKNMIKEKQKRKLEVEVHK